MSLSSSFLPPKKSHNGSHPGQANRSKRKREIRKERILRERMAKVGMLPSQANDN